MLVFFLSRAHDILNRTHDIIRQSEFDREIKVYYVTQVLKQGINTKTVCLTYIL